MKKAAIVITMAILAGCGSPAPEPANMAEIESEASAKAEATIAQLENIADEAVKAAESTNDAATTPERNSAPMCWQDYCPCDDPITSTDYTICRNLRGGVEVSDDQMSIGAEARDLKRAGDASNREMEGIISGMRRGQSSPSNESPTEMGD